MLILQKRRIAEKLIINLIDEILEARGFDGQMLFLPQRDVSARDLLHGGRVPVEVVDRLLAAFDGHALAVLTSEAAASGEEQP